MYYSFVGFAGCKLQIVECSPDFDDLLIVWIVSVLQQPKGTFWF